MTKIRSKVCIVKKYCITAACSTLLASGAAYSADHADSPNQRGSLAARQADITDVYAFMNPSDSDELVLMLLVAPDASGVLPDSEPTPTFASDISYNILMQNYSGTTAGDHLRISCMFTDATPQVVFCGLDSLSVSGDVGTTTATEGLRVFTGITDDPFFFNSGGLNATFNADPPSPMFEEGANPDSPFVNATGQFNAFADQNVLAIVIGVDRDLVTNNQASPELRLWAATAPM
ncbi:DUF4331 family protein [Granulosicoccus antarcticus]|uniref:DUF4331 domain-containing protein n=1 Tax=Granulosicoccus antarcticus IMCC3135 TaxID=1192854 RepID=A0A2Z2NS31_9GAMM|nr:DUF4331 family protein [Granulosicoccus antarcticus]ASJ74282.1 hypothetical protein IMCC3135_21025 [Granulosicoccus antarcticus IMCC3135]